MLENVFASSKTIFYSINHAVRHIAKRVWHWAMPKVKALNLLLLWLNKTIILFSYIKWRRIILDACAIRHNLPPQKSMLFYNRTDLLLFFVAVFLESGFKVFVGLFLFLRMVGGSTADSVSNFFQHLIFIKKHYWKYSNMLLMKVIMLESINLLKKANAKH